MHERNMESEYAIDGSSEMAKMMKMKEVNLPAKLFGSSPFATVQTLSLTLLETPQKAEEFITEYGGNAICLRMYLPVESNSRGILQMSTNPQSALLVEQTERALEFANRVSFSIVVVLLHNAFEQVPLKSHIFMRALRKLTLHAEEHLPKENRVEPVDLIMRIRKTRVEGAELDKTSKGYLKLTKTTVRDNHTSSGAEFFLEPVYAATEIRRRREELAKLRKKGADGPAPAKDRKRRFYKEGSKELFDIPAPKRVYSPGISEDAN